MRASKASASPRLSPAKASKLPPHALAAKRASLAPAQQWLAVDGQKRRLVPPVFEEALRSRGRHRVEEGAIVRTQAREERQVLGAHEDVHTVDLKQAEPADGLAQLRRTDVLMATPCVEALRRERDAASLGS
jgi:hypothetical protein